MKKKLLMAGALILGVLAIGGAVLVARNSRSEESPLVLGPDKALPTPADRYLTWEDPAGFKFDYPAEIKIDPHPEDKINYANLDLGEIKILVQDNPYKTLGDWAKKQQTAGGQVFDSTLGEKPAKKAIFTTPAKIIIAAIDAEVLVTLEGNFDEGDYWTTVFNNLVASFEFMPLASEPTLPPDKPMTRSGSNNGAAGGVVEEEEEIIE